MLRTELSLFLLWLKCALCDVTLLCVDRANIKLYSNVSVIHLIKPEPLKSSTSRDGNCKYSK